MCITREKFHIKGENFPNVDKQNNIKNVEYEEANLHSFFIKDLEKAKEYYQLALQEGYLEAQKELDKLEVEK